MALRGKLASLTAGAYMDAVYVSLVFVSVMMIATQWITFLLPLLIEMLCISLWLLLKALLLSFGWVCLKSALKCNLNWGSIYNIIYIMASMMQAVYKVRKTINSTFHLVWRRSFSDHPYWRLASGTCPLQCIWRASMQDLLVFSGMTRNAQVKHSKADLGPCVMLYSACVCILCSNIKHNEKADSVSEYCLDAASIAKHMTTFDHQHMHTK